MVRANEVEIENGHNAVDTATVKLGELVRLYRKACEDSGRPVKPKSNEDYILQWLHDEFESDFAARLMMQRIVSFAQLRRKAGEGGGRRLCGRHGYLQARHRYSHGLTARSEAGRGRHRAPNPSSPESDRGVQEARDITIGSSAGRPLSAQYRCATFSRMNSKSTAASILRSKWSFGTSSSSVTISSSCCMGAGFLSMMLVKRQSLARGQAFGVLCQQSDHDCNRGFFVA